MVHNRYLSNGAHRLCNMVVGFLLTTVVLLYVNAYLIPAKYQAIGLVVSGVLALSVTLLLGIIHPKRFSIVEGIAGGDGYDELEGGENQAASSGSESQTTPNAGSTVSFRQA